PADGQPLPLFQLQVAAAGRPPARALRVDRGGAADPRAALPRSAARAAGRFHGLPAFRPGADAVGVGCAPPPWATRGRGVNAQVAAPAGASHRARVLRALGLTPWQHRQAAEDGAMSPLDDESLPASANADCVVLLPATCGTRELDLLARAGRVRVQPGEAEIAVPQARAYLACGEAQAHALGRSLPMQATAQAQIVLVDEPGRLLGDAAAKRRLWIALRTLRRSLATTGH